MTVKSIIPRPQSTGRSALLKVALAHGVALLTVIILSTVNSCNRRVEHITRVNVVSLPPAPQRSPIANAPPSQPADAEKPTQEQQANPRRSEPTRATPAREPVKPKSPPTAPKYRTANDIRKQGLTPVPDSKPRWATSSERNSTFDKNEFENRLRRHASPVSIDGNGHSDGVSQVESDYHRVVTGELYRLWDQPSRSEVGGSRTEVTVQLKINRRGDVITKKIVSASGRLAMDQSIASLLANIDRFPAFPANLTAETVTFKVRLTLKQ